MASRIVLTLLDRVSRRQSFNAPLSGHDMPVAGHDEDFGVRLGLCIHPTHVLTQFLSKSVADPDRPCKRKDLMRGIKKCIPEAARDCRHFTCRGTCPRGLTATPAPIYHCCPGLYDFPPPILLLL